MLQGTLDNAPPPFFRQGPSALSKLGFFAALALLLMVADTRLQMTQPLRAALATLLHPIELVLLAPVQVWRDAHRYLSGLDEALERDEAARLALAKQSERALRVEQLEAENARLRGLVALGPALPVRSQPAQLLYEASDPYSRKVFVDRGSTHGVALASPVINERGVFGQVTRVYPLSSEVTLLIDKDATIPVMNARTQVQSAAFGVSGGLELRFVASNADVQVGDKLLTSGLDGIYPAGLPVAEVTHVDRKSESGFARIALVAASPQAGVRHVLLLEPIRLQLPPRPDPPADETLVKGRKGARK